MQKKPRTMSYETNETMRNKGNAAIYFRGHKRNGTQGMQGTQETQGTQGITREHR